MKIALLSDIHANLTALEAVLQDAAAAGVDGGAWVAGDIVGYGPDPNECIDRLRDDAEVAVAGNHDLAAIGSITTAEFNPVAASAANWTAGELTDVSRSYLEGLPRKYEQPPFTIVHGSPRDPVWEYLLTVEAARANLDHFSTPGCMVGHSHLQFLIHMAGRIPKPAPTPLNRPLDIGPERFYVNPGSVGQPRDGDPRAGYAILDRDNETVEFRRVEYDIVATQERMTEAKLPKRLIERLTWGR